MVVGLLVWDVLGAAGETARKFTSPRCEGSFGQRFGVNASRVSVIGLLRERLASRLVHGIAAFASGAVWRIDPDTSTADLLKSAPFAVPIGAQESP